jgi:hypothetical protein
MPTRNLTQMATQPQHGTLIGKWRLDSFLGRGGNAVVWSGVDDHGHLGAVKLLINVKSSREPFKRFRREIETHRHLTEMGEPGVLPLLDYYLPEPTSAREQPFLVTSLATPIIAALQDAQVADVIVAIRDIARTLDSLHRRGLGHRDVKPENLYNFNEQWMLGDFGLVDVPDAEELTTGAKALGPRYYLAPEMVAAPETALSPPADVYSLGKTLWVLLTGQRYPLPGPHRLEEPLMALETYVAGASLRPLDLLLERMTTLSPIGRPDAGAVAVELESWLQFHQSPVGRSEIGANPSLAIAAGNLKAEMAPGRRQAEQRARRFEQCDELTAVLRGFVAELANDLHQHGVEVTRDDNETLMPLALQWQLLNEEFRWGHCAVVEHYIPSSGITVDRRAREVYLWSGVALRTTSDGEAFVGFGHAVGSAHPQTTWTENCRGHLGSALLAAQCRDLAATLRAEMLPALTKFTEAVQRL